MMNPEPTGKTCSVIIADDHAIIREAIRDLLDNSAANDSRPYTVVATAENGLEAIAAVKAHQPDLLFLDISMPLASGAEIIHDIRRWSPDTRIAVFTGISAAGVLAGVVEAGADGLFSKALPARDMVTKLPLLLSGGRYVAQEFAELLRRGQQSGALTARERQVLNMIVAGKSNKEIAGELYISPKTVEKHRASVMNKLEAHSVVQLMARALQDGLIDPSPASMG
ncbi:response regulator transcription factor [Synechococcus sp. BSF8S]|uniref:LuxR C-terminal-related transcriptional regulator n=2 Tax=Synechococcales TaxID=1890424 RepID=UPI001626FE7F|nr:response regulator transcription factor [Synechococcus sp. BSF8S]MBC1265451.1 response regulator transcription factor [Synechococcus sp. BSA11S]